VSTLKKPPAPPRPVEFEISLTLPVTVVSEMNRRDHWAVRKKRFDKQADVLFRGIVALAWYDQVHGYLWPWRFPVMVKLTRLYNRGPAMDDDNLRGAFKAVRDAIAEWAGVDDGLHGSGRSYQRIRLWRLPPQGDES
jgi:hypothetical protein